MSEQKYEPITDSTTVIQEGDEFRYRDQSLSPATWRPFKESIGSRVESCGPVVLSPIEVRRPIKTPLEKWVVFCSDDVTTYDDEDSARKGAEAAVRLGIGPAYYGILKGVCRSQVVWGDE